MDWLNSGEIVLSSIGAHLFVPVLGVFSIPILIGIIFYFLFRRRIRRTLEIRKLKAKVDGVKERLRSIQVITSTVAINLIGPGPFQLPQVTQLSWLVPTEGNRVMAGFLSEDQARIYARISYRALAQLLNDQRAAPLQKQTLLPATPIGLDKRDEGYESPILARCEGHFDLGRKLRILVFSTKDGRKILFPLSMEICQQFLVQCKATLVFYKEEKRLHELPVRNHPKSGVVQGA